MHTAPVAVAPAARMTELTRRVRSSTLDLESPSRGPGRPRALSATKQPPREDARKNQVADRDHHTAAGNFTEKPERHDDHKGPCLADRGERNERAVDGPLTGEPGIRAPEERNEKRQER